MEPGPGNVVPRPRSRLPESAPRATETVNCEEITRIIKVRYEKAVKFLEEHKATVERIAQRLLEIETIGEEEFRALADVDLVPASR